MWKRIRSILLLLVPVAVALYSIGGTLNYYFYSDDYSILYFVQRNRLPGWPYDEAYLFLFKPLYVLLGLRPLGYFALGVLTYIAATFGVYALMRTITKSRGVAYLAAIIFATGYVGIDQYNMMMVSSVNNLAIVLIAATLILYMRWMESKNRWLYLLSLSVCALSFKLFLYRAYSLILFIPTLDFVYALIRSKQESVLRQLFFVVTRAIPVYFLGKYFGIFEYGDVGSFSREKIAFYTSPTNVSEFFAIFGRMIAPSQILVKAGIAVDQNIYGIVGIGATLGVGLLSWLLLKKVASRRIGFSLLMAITLTFEAYAGNFLLLPSFDSGGPVNRYLPIAFVGFSALLPLIVVALGEFLKINRVRWSRMAGVSIVFGYSAVLAISSHDYVLTMTRDRGLPAAKFFSQLKSYIPVMPERLTVYIDSPEYYPAIPRLGNILSNAYFPYEVTFAVTYNVPIDRVTFVKSFDQYVDLLSSSKDPKGTFYSFFYDGNTLHNTTGEMLESLKTDKSFNIAQPEPPSMTVEKDTIASLDAGGVPSFGDLELELMLTLKPLRDDQFTYPYFFSSPSATQMSKIRDFYDKKQVDRTAIYGYMVSRSGYYSTVSATASDSHLSYPPALMVDNRFDTWWLYAEHLWQLKYKTYFVIDLGMTKRISRALWIPMKNRELENYRISVSLDGSFWQPVDFRASRLESGEMIVISDAFAPTRARYVRYDIETTKTGQTPGIIDIEIVEDEHASVDPFVAWRVGNTPFEYLKDPKELRETYNYIAANGFVRVFTKTNNEDVLANRYFVSLPVRADGQSRTYRMPLSSRGTKIEKIGIQVWYPVQMLLENARINRRKVLD